MQAVCNCAILAAFPLWWESVSSFQIPAGGQQQLSSCIGAGGQIDRVAQLAVQNCSILLGCHKAVLYLTKEGGAHSTSDSKLEAYEWSDNAGGRLPSGSGQERRMVPAVVQRREIIRPPGHGRQGGLLGRCLRKGQVLNVGDPLSQERYNKEIDGRDASATLYVPLRWPGKTVLGVLRVSMSF